MEMEKVIVNPMLGVNLVGVEHWVGGVLEFARLWN